MKAPLPQLKERLDAKDIAVLRDVIVPDLKFDVEMLLRVSADAENDEYELLNAYQIYWGLRVSAKLLIDTISEKP